MIINTKTNFIYFKMQNSFYIKISEEIAKSEQFSLASEMQVVVFFNRDVNKIAGSGHL